MSDTKTTSINQKAPPSLTNDFAVRDDHPADQPDIPKIKLSLKDLPDLLTVREVAEILRVSPLTIKRWGKKGKLPFIRINSRGDRRYKKEAVLWLLGIEPKE